MQAARRSPILAGRTPFADPGAPLARVALIFLTGVVGISFAAVFVRVALPAPPVVTAFYRLLFAGTLVGAWLLVTRRPLLPGGRPALLAALSGLCFGTDLALWHSALVRTSVATATLLVNTAPLYVGAFALVVWRERLDRRYTAGAALALGGMAVLLGVPSLGEGEIGGALLALAGAVFYAGYQLLMKAARGGIATVPAFYVATVCGAAVVGLYGWALGDPFRGFPASSWAAMGAAAVVSHVGGVMGIVWAMRFLPATLTSVALLAQPVGTALLGWLLLDEPLGPAQMLGGTAVLAGILLASRASGAQPPAGPALKPAPPGHR